MGKRIRRKIDKHSRYYIDPDEYQKELMSYKKSGVASDRLGELFMLHVERCASANKFKSYTYRNEMESTALFHLLKYSKSFNPIKKLKSGKKPSAFNYCTTIIHHAFIQVINKEKKHSILKDNLIKDQQDVNHESMRFSILNKVDD